MVEEVSKMSYINNFKLPKQTSIAKNMRTIMTIEYIESTWADLGTDGYQKLWRTPLYFFNMLTFVISQIMLNYIRVWSKVCCMMRLRTVLFLEFS